MKSAVNERTTLHSCPDCVAAAIRDEKLIDALQTARLALNGRDGTRDLRIRDARVKAAIDEALRLVGARP